MVQQVPPCGPIVGAVAARILGFVYAFGRPRAEAIIVGTGRRKANEKSRAWAGVRDGGSLIGSCQYLVEGRFTTCALLLFGVAWQA